MPIRDSSAAASPIRFASGRLWYDEIRVAEGHFAARKAAAET